MLWLSGWLFFPLSFIFIAEQQINISSVWWQAQKTWKRRRKDHVSWGANSKHLSEHRPVWRRRRNQELRTLRSLTHTSSWNRSSLLWMLADMSSTILCEETSDRFGRDMTGWRWISLHQQRTPNMNRHFIHCSYKRRGRERLSADSSSLIHKFQNSGQVAKYCIYIHCNTLAPPVLTKRAGSCQNAAFLNRPHKVLSSSPCPTRVMNVGLSKLTRRQIPHTLSDSTSSSLLLQRQITRSKW